MKDNITFGNINDRYGTLGVVLASKKCAIWQIHFSKKKWLFIIFGSQKLDFITLKGIDIWKSFSGGGHTYQLFHAYFRDMHFGQLIGNQVPSTI